MSMRRETGLPNAAQFGYFRLFNFAFWDEARMVDLGFMYSLSLPDEALTPAEYPENRDLAFRWASIMQNEGGFTSDFPTISQD
jgi:hypothetical protein